ncbi:MAG TPA: hypothetical protein VFK47_16755 [Ktedonobacteraceae bacterium]|nr:hypothetical protein [Ktedonobacteraceae bacterium]
MKIAYTGADTGIPVLDNKGASTHIREFTDAMVEWQEEAQQFIAHALSMEPNAQKNHLLQVVRL